MEACGLSDPDGSLVQSPVLDRLCAALPGHRVGLRREGDPADGSGRKEAILYRPAGVQYGAAAGINLPVDLWQNWRKRKGENVLSYKKPAFWVIVAAVIACAVVTVCFATNPKQELSQEQRIDELRVKYPEYFEVGTFKGLEVYVWQMTESDYRFGLMEGSNREKILDELMALKGATAEEMALILSTYDIEDKSIFVIPWQNPISSYMVMEDMAKDPEYINNIRTMLGLDGA